MERERERLGESDNRPQRRRPSYTEVARLCSSRYVGETVTGKGGCLSAT